MTLYKRGAVLLVIAALIISFSGCVEKTVPVTYKPDPSIPGAQAIPIPIPGSYLQNSSITNFKINDSSVNNSKLAANTVNDTQFAPNAIPYNVTVNTTDLTVKGLVYVPLYNNGSITVNRTSFVVVQWSGEVGINGTNSSYMTIALGGVNMTTSPMKLLTNTDSTSTYPTNCTRTVLMYNASVNAGTYTVVPTVNGSTNTAVVTFGRQILITTAYPHS